MTMMSPGVQTREIDLSGYVPAVNSTVGAFCGVFRWGPLDEIVTLSDEGGLVSRFGKPNLDVATSFFTAARFLSYADALRVVRVAATISQGVAFTVTTDGTKMTGTGFLTAPRLRPGSLVQKTSGQTTEVRVVVSVKDDTEATLDSDFTDDLSNDPVTINTYIGTLNATAEEGTGTGDPGIGALIRNQQDYESNYSDGLANVGPFAAKYPGVLGNSLEVSICPATPALNGDGSANTGKNGAFLQTLAGTVTSGSTNVLNGTNTDFASTVIPGTILRDVASGQERTVVEVTSIASLKLDSQFSPALSGATVTAKWEYASAIGVIPGTSSFNLNKQGKNDEIHAVVVDAGGEFTGIPGTILERFSFMSLASDAKSEDGTSTYYVNKINRSSNYVYWTDHIPAGSNWGSAAGTNFTVVSKPSTYRLSGGTDVNTGQAIDAARNLGYDLFADTESVDLSILLAGEASTAVALHVMAIAETRQDCIGVISPLKDDVVDNAGSEATDIIAFRETLPSSSWSIMSSNWLYIYDKFRDTFVWIPDCGDIAGIVARSDSQNYAWTPPAGYNRGILKEVVRLAWNPKKAARDDLYLVGVNFVVSQNGSGPVWLGDKTMLLKPSAFDHINVRRLFIVIRKAIAKTAKYLIHEINDSKTQNLFRNQTEPYMADVQSKGGVYDFRVVCDGTTNTPEVVDRNEFVGNVLVKPSKAIDNITLNFVAARTGVAFNEIVGSF
jgi:hypothetical protein